MNKQMKKRMDKQRKKQMKKQFHEYEEQMYENETHKGYGMTIACTVLGCLIIAIVVLFTAFRVDPNEVEVEGNIHYTKEEIKKWVLDDFISENTILASLFKGDKNIEDIAFIEAYQVEYMDRNKICIIVDEKEVVGYVEENTKCYYFDRDGAIVEETDGPVLTAEERQMQEERKANEEAGVTGEDGIAPQMEETKIRNFVPPVRGLAYTIETTSGKDVSQASERKRLIVENKTIFNTMASLKQMINKDNIPPEYVYFDEEYNIYLFYEAIEVRLGQDIDLENKMSTLAAIMPKIEGMEGVLKLENYSNIQSGVIFQKKESPKA